jgi:hypothetical protein
MSMVEEVARLILEADTKGFADAQNQIVSTQRALDTLTANYRSGAVGVEEYYREGRRLQAQLEDARAAYQVATDAVTKYGSAQRAAAAMAAQSMQKSTAASRGAQQAMLEFSRGVEDFSTGGFLGVLNNIPRTFEGIAQAIGLSQTAIAGWTTGISLAATGAYILYKNWDTIVTLFQETRAFERAANDIAAMERELKAAKDRLEELEKLSAHTAEQTAEYNRLRERSVQLEKDITEQKQLQADLDKLRQLEPDKEEKAARAKMLEGVIAEEPDIDTLIGGVERARRAKLLQTRDQLAKAAAKMPVGEQRMQLNLQAMEITNELGDLAKLRENAEIMVRDAVKRGLAGATSDVANLMRFAPQHFLPEHVAGFEQAERMLAPKTAQQKAAEKQTKAMLDAADGIDQDNKRQFEAGMKILRAKEKEQQKLLDACDAIDQDNKRQSEAGLRAIKAQEKLQAQQIDKGAAAFGKEVAGQARAMGGFQAQGEAALARGIAGGQFEMGANGQLSAASFQRLNELVSAELLRQMPNLGIGQRAALSQQLSSNIEKGVGEKFLQQAGTGIDAQMATQNVVMETQQAVAAIGNRLRQVEARNAQLARNNADLRRQLAAPGPTNLNAGAP